MPVNMDIILVEIVTMHEGTEVNITKQALDGVHCLRRRAVVYWSPA